ncbi:MAG: SDR family oxidoreductase [Gemmataceae bacterium]|nr:SDR family oxidoreductase [Gemmataceae bacterium]
MTEEEIAAWGSDNPWGRVAAPRDIARAVLYLASDQSEYVTGQTIFVNGG